MKRTLVFSSLIIIFSLLMLTQCSSVKNSPGADDTGQIISTNLQGKGLSLELEFSKGKSYGHPLLAVWMEDTNGNYIQSLYVSKSIATGIYLRGANQSGQWEPGPQRRPAGLPYWSHQRGVKAADGLYVPDQGTEVPDAYTGATPSGNFILKTNTDKMPSMPFVVLLEINKPFDFNEFWSNGKFPGDNDYATSGQPSLIFAVAIDPARAGEVFSMQMVGRGHHSGADGKLYNDLNTITTAREMVGSINVRISGTGK